MLLSILNIFQRYKFYKFQSVESTNVNHKKIEDVNDNGQYIFVEIDI